MKDREHRLIVNLAFDCLAGPAARIWRAARKEMLATCLLPDERALLRGKDGPRRRYFPKRVPKFNFEQTGRGSRAFLPDSRFYIGQVVAHLKRGDVTEAARFAGVYSHYIGDFTQPAHYFEFDLGDLLPPPASMRNCNYHRLIEDVPSTVRSLRYRPRLIGLTLAETLFRIDGRYAELYRRTVAAALPMVRALYRKQRERASRVLDPIVLDSARLFADFLHTCAALAHRSFDEREAAALRVCDLRDIDPHAYDVEYNFGHRPLLDAVTLDGEAKAREFALIERAGRQRVVRPVKGICIVPHALPMPGVTMSSSLAYRLPRDTFDRFTARVGLLAGLARQARCGFEVIADGRARCSTPMLRPSDPARPVDVAIAGARRVCLRVRSDGATDRLAFPIWAFPRLVKA